MSMRGSTKTPAQVFALVFGIVGFTAVGDVYRDAGIDAYTRRAEERPLDAAVGRALLALVGLVALALGGVIASL